jgi:hypothetical protein
MLLATTHCAFWWWLWWVYFQYTQSGTLYPYFLLLSYPMMIEKTTKIAIG